MFEGMPVVLVHHRGAKSGTERVNPLVYLKDGDRIVVFASKAGAPTNPAWYHNLLAHPDTKIELGTDELVRPRRARQPARSATASSRSRSACSRSSPTTRRKRRGA